MRDQVVELLTALGVTGVSGDPLLDLALATAPQRIMNFTNLPTMPDELASLAVSMAAGEYLNLKKGTGQLEGFDLETAIKQIQQGDTNISFAIGDGSLTPEQRLDSLIDFLSNGRRDELYRFRRLVW